MRVLSGLWLFLFAGLALLSAQEQKDIFSAVRDGNLKKVRSLIESGVDVDTRDRYGMTPLAVSAQTGQLEIAAYLLEKKADVNIPDTFYHVTPLLQSLWNQNSGVAELLLKAGAEPRDSAFEIAVYRGLPKLMRAAIEGGPISESTLARLKDVAASKEQSLQDIFATAKSRPDPEPPNYSAEELKQFEGNFEGFESDTKGRVFLKDGTLFVSVNDAEPVALVAVSDKTFKSEDGETRFAFTGRAGAIEGFRLMKGQDPPDLLRHSVAEPIKTALAEGAFPEKPIKTESKKPLVNWPGFRGPEGSGIGDGTRVPVQWDLEKGEGILWKTQLVGLGNSSPVVWGDKVFITTAVGEGVEQKIRVGNTGDASTIEDATEHRWLVYAFDKTTGKEIWNKEIGRATPLTQRHFKATQANSTPVTDGRHLIVVFPTAGLACLDFSGKVLWHKELGGLNASAFYSPETQWGFAASPILYKNSVILQVDVYGEPYIAAWDIATGKQLWKTDRKVATSWSTPVIFPTSKGDELVVNGSTIYGYDPNNGKELWHFGPNSELVIAMPVVGDDVVYVSAGYPPIKPIYAVKAGIRGGHEFSPGKTDENLVWSHPRGGAYLPTPLYYGGLYYVVHHNGRLVVYDAKSGTPIHKTRFSQRGTFTASPIIVDGKIYTATEEGILYVVDAKPDFKELAAHDFEEPLMATPAASEGLLLVRTPSKLIAIGELEKAD